jgi:hypothetical protein
VRYSDGMRADFCSSCPPNNQPPIAPHCMHERACVRFDPQR